MKDELAAAADVLLHNVEHSTRAGMKLILQLQDIADLKTFETITRFKNGHAGGIYVMILLGEDWRWSGEVMFLGWSASHTGGVKLRFALNEDSDLKFLMDVPRGTKASMGMREMDGDGQMVDESRKEKVETERGGPLSKRAAQLGRDAEYQKFLQHLLRHQVTLTESECADYIRAACGVSSRAMLDHDARAAREFQETVLKPYVQYLYETP